MAFWSTETFRTRGVNEDLVAPFNPQHVRHGAYELAVGPEISITAKDSQTKETLADRQAMIIPPGQFGLLLTEEVITAPLNAIGFISIRASIKFEGLVNVSGFHVDPGFKGRLKFSVYNAGAKNIVLSRGDRVFMLWFAELDRATTDGYGGERPGQNEITSRDIMRMQGEVASPAQLQKDIADLSHSVTNLKYVVGVFATLAGSLAVALVVVLLRGSVFSLPAIPPVRQETPAVGRTESDKSGTPEPRKRLTLPQGDGRSGLQAPTSPTDNR